MKKIFKKVLSGIVLAAILLAAIGCGNTGANTSGASKDGKDSGKKVIRIASPTADASALVENAGVALKYGYLDEELKAAGYTVEYYGFGQGGTAINEAIASGEIDVAFVGDVPLIIGKSNGLDIEAFALLNAEAAMGIIIGNGSDITSVADLKGKKVCAAFGTVTYIYLVKILAANGLSIDDVEVINDIANGAALLASGDTDAVVSTGAGVQQMQAYGVGKVLTTSDDTPELSSLFYAAGSKKFIDNNPEAIEAIIRALKKARTSFEADPAKTYGILESDAVPAAIFAQIYPEARGFAKFEPYLVDSSKAKFNSTVDILFESQIITKKITADEFYNNSYNEKVYKELGEAIPQ